MRVIDRDRGRLPGMWRYGPRSRAMACRVLQRMTAGPMLTPALHRPSARHHCCGVRP